MKTIIFGVILLTQSVLVKAALMHGIFDGVVSSGGTSGVSIGDSFQLRFEIDVPNTISLGSAITPNVLEIEVNGLKGVFPDAIILNSNMSLGFEVISPLTAPNNVFNSISDTPIGLSIDGMATGTFNQNSLLNPFIFGPTNTSFGEFYPGQADTVGLMVTSGFYANGALPQVPLPPSFVLLGSSILILQCFNKARQNRSAALHWTR